MRTTSTSPSLELLRAEKTNRDDAEVRVLLATIDWALEHEIANETDPRLGFIFGDTGAPMGGPGCPVISEYAVHDLALVLGVSSDSGGAYLAKTLELRYRLPLLFARVITTEVPVWKAFKVAERTLYLSAEAARFVDRALAPVAHSCSFAQVDRTVDAALARFDPAEAERRREAAGERRRFDLDLDSAGTDGTVQVDGVLDLADALDLEKAVATGARELADLGSEESLNVRRAKALGHLARGQQTLDLDTPDSRTVTLYAHLDASEVGHLENTKSPALVEQIKAWCQAAGTKVFIRPVIDLNQNVATTSYTPTEAMREQAALTNATCVFPRCARDSRRCDLDHIQPYDRGGPTESDNLAPLCRRHHRLKTFTGWTYTQTAPGRFVWTSHEGLTYLVEPRPRLT